MRVMSQSMGDLKSSKQALGAGVLTDLADFAPPTVTAQASRLQSRQRCFNFVVTNVPGPQFPLYLLGRRLLETFPMVPLAKRQAVCFGIMSYDGTVNFGLIGGLRRDGRPRGPRGRPRGLARRAVRGRPGEAEARAHEARRGQGQREGEELLLGPTGRDIRVARVKRTCQRLAPLTHWSSPSSLALASAPLMFEAFASRIFDASSALAASAASLVFAVPSSMSEIQES